MKNMLLSYFSVVDHKIHPLTLRFFDKKIESEYLLVHNQDVFLQVRFGTVLALTLFLIHGVLDIYAYPSHYHEIWITRAVTIIALFILLLTTFKETFVTALQRSSILLVFISGLSLIYMYSYDIETEYGYIFLASYVLLIAGAFTLAGLIFINALLTMFVLDLFLIAVFAAKVDALTSLFYAVLFISISVIMLINGYFSEILSRKLFLKERFSKSMLDELTQTKELLKEQNRELSNNQMVMVQQARLASTGEMIGNIAHQWRQPLNTLGLIAQKVSIFHNKGLLDDEKLQKSLAQSLEIINGMSATIDDFRAFFNPNKEKEEFLIMDAINRSYAIIEASLRHHKIRCEIECKNREASFYGYKNEFSQVIINLLNNAQDALVENGIMQGVIVVEVIKLHDVIQVVISDNGGGIKIDNLHQIFEPYFTTKEEGKGTGVGLYMSKLIIEEHMQGKLSVKNCGGGACFTVELY